MLIEEHDSQQQQQQQQINLTMTILKLGLFVFESLSGVSKDRQTPGVAL